MPEKSSAEIAQDEVEVLTSNRPSESVFTKPARGMKEALAARVSTGDQWEEVAGRYFARRQMDKIWRGKE